MTFTSPSDVIIKIEIENEVHDIHVMVRPGVKEFLENMDKYYEIVIFTASVSKYADPLLDIIDKQGYCPFRLFREHCSLINTTFVKDLQRLGRDLKDIVIVDNSPLSYALHPENGLPILTWFEDKNDMELYKIIPVLEFLSSVPDVRDFIPKIVGNNKINYQKANEIINEYNGPRYNIQDKENYNENRIKNNKIENDIKINIEFIEENGNNKKVLKNQNKTNKNNKKFNKNEAQDPLINLAMKNIIASVSPESVMQSNNNQIIINKNNSKNKLNNKKKLENKNDDKNLIKDKKDIKIELNDFINVKKLNNNNSHSTKKKIKSTITDKNFNTFQSKRISNSAGGNRLKNNSHNLISNSKSIILNSNINNNGGIKYKNQTPKINKTINLLNNNIYTTRSVKYPKKNNIYSSNMTPNNNKLDNKISKSLTKNVLNSEEISNKENILNKNKKNNTINKTFTSNININNSPKQNKELLYNNFKPLKDNKKQQGQNSTEKIKKYNKKNELNKFKNNNFLKTGSIQQKINYTNNLNNNNVNIASSLSFSNKYNNSNEININSIDYIRSNRSNNQIKINPANSHFINEIKNINHSPNKRYEKTSNTISNNNFNLNSHNYIKNKSLTLKKNTTSNLGAFDKDNNYIKNQKKILNNNFKTEVVTIVNGVKTTRPKSSSTVKLVTKNNITKDNPKNIKYPTKKNEINNHILVKRGISNKYNSTKKKNKK